MRRGFTLIELLVVVGILFVLAGLVSSAVRRVNELSKESPVQQRPVEMPTVTEPYRSPTFQSQTFSTQPLEADNKCGCKCAK